MTHKELAQRRVECWRLRPDLAPNDEKEIRKFIKDCGFCYTYHTPGNTLPSLIQTISGSTAGQKHFSYSLSDPYQEMLKETFYKYNKQKLFVEVGVFGKHPVIIYRDVFANLYRIIGTEIRGGYLSRRKRNTNIENAVTAFLNEKGPAPRRELRLSVLPKQAKKSDHLSKALDSLAKQLKIIRIRDTGDNNIKWTTPERWNPQLCSDSKIINREDAIEYLIFRFIRISIATSRKAMKRFFINIIPTNILDLHLNSMIQRKIIVIDPVLIIDGKHALMLNKPS